MTTLAERIDLAPPKRLPTDGRMPLGAVVNYHHRAFVARWSPFDQGRKEGMWRVVEGGAIPQHGDPFASFDFDDSTWWTRTPTRNGNNKTVVVWPEEGKGLLIGLVRRGIGESYRSHYSRGSMFEEPDYDPGGFAAQGFVWLYAIKHELQGVAYSLCPWWAVQRP